MSSACLLVKTVLCYALSYLNLARYNNIKTTMADLNMDITIVQKLRCRGTLATSRVEVHSKKNL